MCTPPIHVANTVDGLSLLLLFLCRLGYARVSHGGLSDTEVQIGKFRLPDYDNEPDNDRMTHDSHEVPEWTHFPTTV